ncbi:hypothetical protein JTB14_010338 [Gonioctena quinquepunctata]|nr:hypothetical protein JTB14_010338 [Gonioctena quinquepunctata]
MSFVPPDLSQACAVYTNLTTCQPSTFLFLQLVTSLFGYSKDSQNNHQGFTNAFGYSDFFTNSFSGEDKSPKDEEYDFIVVGAGSAGCVVANRLSEIKKWRVLLLEAGDEEPVAADVPAFAPMLQASNIDWGYSTQPSHKSCLARDEGRCTWARDYDEWEEMGNHGWSYADVLPYFIKSEDNRNPDKIDPHYHGVGGYQTVEIFSYQDANTLGLVEAYQELGLPKSIRIQRN